MCVCVCVRVCVCVTYSFSVFNYILVALFLVLQRPPKSPLLYTFPFTCYTLTPLSPLLYPDVNAPLPLISVLLHILLSEPPRYARPSILWIPSLGGLRPAMETAVQSLLHPPDYVFVGCTPTCPWLHGGKGCWISLSLGKSNILRRHTSTNIPASAYY